MKSNKRNLTLSIGTLLVFALSVWAQQGSQTTPQTPQKKD